MITAGARYAALGSSFAAGPGIDPIVDESAGRSGRNYAHLVAERLRLELTDVTCSGAVSSQLLRPGRPLGRLPLPGRRVPPQLDAVPADAALVTLTIGGNDLGYVGGLFRATAVNLGPGRLPVLGPRVAARTRVSTEPAAVESLVVGLTAAVTALHGRAPDARVLIVDYPTIVGPMTVPELPLTDAQREQARELAARLTGAYRTVVARTGSELVGVAAASHDHHAGSAEPWVTGWLGRSGVSFHPNAAGMAAVADLIIEHLDDGHP